MTALRRALAFAILCAACSGGSPPPAPPPTPAAVVEEPTPEPAPEPEGPTFVDETPDGTACDTTADCEAGQHCRGPAGCEATWACGPPRECGEETVGWCGCDGFTFYAPENCPGRHFLHPGPCEALGVVDDEPVEEVEGNAVCQTSDDCPSGFVCAGSEGCSTLWTCVRRLRMRPRCGRREETFCSCEGDSFSAIAECPGRPFLHRGYCPGDEPPEPVVAEGMDAGVPSVASARRDAGAPPAPSGPRVCVRNRDCPRGQVCMGDEGCTSDWHCGRPPERCNPDTQYFCSCGGETFTASMTCPGQPHRHRGSCLPEERAR